MKKKRWLALMLCLMLALAGCGGETPASEPPASAASAAAPEPSASAPSETDAAPTPSAQAEPEMAAEYTPTQQELAQRQKIEDALNLKNMEQMWSYASDADAWVLSPVVDVLEPVLPEYQGVSLAAPGAYVIGLDTDGDGSADLHAGDMGQDPVAGALVIDHQAQVISDYGQTYTADTCPVIFTTGAVGYGAQANSAASTTYCAQGYVAVSCGNRGKQSYVSDPEGNVEYYTGDAPDCLCDQKAAVRFIKYNMLLGNLPGSVDYWVSTGGSGGAAHAAMYAATSNHPDFYDYQIAAGAVGVYANSDGSYTAAVTIQGEPVALPDGVWGAIPYSAITSLDEGDMAQAFEYYLDPEYSFSTDFQARLAEYLAQAYQEHINARGYTAPEQALGFDLNGDGDQEDTIPLTIEYDPEKYPDTHGYGGSYLDLYLAEFQSNLQWYLDNLSYAQGWTWFDSQGSPLSDEAVAAMTGEDRAQAFLEGRYARPTVGFGGPMGAQGGMMGPLPDMMGPPPAMAGGDAATAEFGAGIRNGGPDAGTTAAAGSSANSANYASYDEMVAAYAADIAEIQAGDAFGKNIVALYDPTAYIGAPGTENPTWTRVVMGAVEGDMPLMASLNMQLQWLSAGTYAQIEWQWDGGHVPNEIFGESLNLYVDEMYGKFVSGAPSAKPEAAPPTENGDAEAPNGTDLSGWVDGSDWTAVRFTLGDAMAYRNTGAMKAVPGFDVIDYGQEDYEFGSPERDARHWNVHLLEIFQDPEKAEVLKKLF